MPDSRPAGRRSYDRDLDPVVETFVEKRITETRHELRAEFTATLLGLERKVSEVSAQVAHAAVQARTEHVENRGMLEQLRVEVAKIPPVAKRVEKLERHEDIDDARQAVRDELLSKVTSTRKWAVGLCVVVAASAVPQLVSLIHHAS